MPLGCGVFAVEALEAGAVVAHFHGTIVGADLAAIPELEDSPLCARSRGLQ